MHLAMKGTKSKLKMATGEPLKSPSIFTNALTHSLVKEDSEMTIRLSTAKQGMEVFYAQNV